MVELDNNATTRPAPEVVEAVAAALTSAWHNPSSAHRAGQTARRTVELARRSVADLVGASPREIVFTAGATESIDLAVRGALLASPPERRRVVTSPVEHEAVRELCGALEREGLAEVALAPVDGEGRVDGAALASMLDERVALVSVQWANNETGAVQPVVEIGEACRAAGCVFHCDATQWVGKEPTDLRSGPAGVGLLSLSAHKFHGPKGAGALVARRGVRLRPTVHGAQELGRRGGTENTPGIAGMGAAAELARAWLADPALRAAAAARRDRLESGLLARLPDASVNGPTRPGERLWNTTNIAFPRLEAEALLLAFSEKGLNASAGAACSSGSLDPSPVLLAMGVPEARAHGSIRFSISRETTDEEIDAALEIVPACVERLRASTARVV